MRQVNHFVDGRSLVGSSGNYGKIFDPNTGAVQAEVQLATQAEVDLVVASAAAAHRSACLTTSSQA